MVVIATFHEDILYVRFKLSLQTKNLVIKWLKLLKKIKVSYLKRIKCYFQRFLRKGALSSATPASDEWMKAMADEVSSMLQTYKEKEVLGIT